jgi:UDP-3-O-[3-hydroxymyristoyl] glucosamine N-acyltransferase
MKYRLSTFQGVAGLDVLRDGEFVVTGKLSTAIDGLCAPLRSAEYVDQVNASPHVTAVITTHEIAEALDPRFAIAVADNPDAAHAEVHAQLAEAHEASLRAQPSSIDASAIIDPAASVAGYGVTIGARVRLGPNVVVAPGVTIENDCVLHSGVNLGVTGFNTARLGGRQRIIPHLGGVRLEPYVELLANCCVARGLSGIDTIVGEETVADNLVYIAHDVKIGRRVQICALANILGRVVIGDEAYIGPSAVIRNGLRIGAKAKVSIGAVVTQDVAENSVVSGNFAISHDRFISHVRSIR